MQPVLLEPEEKPVSLSEPRKNWGIQVDVFLAGSKRPSLLMMDSTKQSS